MKKVDTIREIPDKKDIHERLKVIKFGLLDYKVNFEPIKEVKHNTANSKNEFISDWFIAV